MVLCFKHKNFQQNGSLPSSPARVPEISINQEPITNTKQPSLPKSSENASMAKTGLTPIVAASSLIDPKEVGHNIYILAHQLSRHNDELASQLNPDNIKDEESSTKKALEFYKSHTAMIEVYKKQIKHLIFLDCAI